MIFYLLIPAIAAVVYYYMFRLKYNLLFYFIPLALSLLTIWIVSATAEYSQTVDKEYWGSVVMEAHYEEPWDEYISKTCTESYACGKDSKGNTQYCTRTYDCSYVDYHSAMYYVVDNLGDKYSITEKDYNWYKQRYGNNPRFVDMHRDYHSQDGDMYVCNWPGNMTTHVSFTTEHSYENRVQAAHDVFNFAEVDDSDAVTYKLFQYPKPDGNMWCSPILADSSILINDSALLKLSYMNATMGKRKQLRFMLLLYNDMPRSSGDMQEQMWKGGNKNEFIVCVGLKSGKVSWCKVISWTENQGLKIRVRDFVEEQTGTVFDQNAFADYVMPMMEGFERKHFKDFSYLQVDVPLWADILCVFLLFGYSIAGGILLYKNK